MIRQGRFAIGRAFRPAIAGSSCRFILLVFRYFERCRSQPLSGGG